MCGQKETGPAGKTQKYGRKITVMAAPSRKYQMSTDKHMRVTINAC